MYLRRTTLGLLAACLLGAALAAVAWAGYTGPDRTTTEEVRDKSKDVWTCTRGGSSCEFAAGKPSCGNHPSTGSQLSVCGWVASNCSCEKAYKDKTTTHDPATVSGSFECDEAGDNGWCVGGASLVLNADEPMGGEVIEVIEGDPGGVLCDPSDAAQVSCSWSDGGQGSFNVDYWAVSSYGDTSEKGSTGWKLDSQDPSAGLETSGGDLGGAGWYVDGTVTVTASGSDSVSGVASKQVALGGGSWEDEIEIDSDGVHQITARVVDAAGNTASKDGEVKYDGSAPSVSGSFNGTKGDNGWYVSSVTASASASDGLSGVDHTEVKIDGGSWQSSPAEISGDGTHQVSFRASDKAGNESGGGDDTVRIDRTAPHSAFRTPEEGSDGTWVSGDYTFVGNSSDATSGLASLELSLNGGGSWRALSQSGGSWSYSWDSRSVPNGTYVILVRARDVAGNRESTARVTVHVDNQAPMVDIPDSWQLGDYAPLTVREQDIGLDRVEIEIAAVGSTMLARDYDAGEVPASVEWNGQAPNGQPAGSGEYVVTATAWDLAGNRGVDTGILLIPSLLPVDVPPPIVDDTVPIGDDLPIVISNPLVPQPQPGAPQDVIGGVPGAQAASWLASSLAAELQALGFRRIWIWPAFAWAGLLFALGYAKLTDRRPDELRGLRADLHRIRKLQK